MTQKKEVEEFYDTFVDYQHNIGVSIRHRLIFKKLKSIGLKKDSNVLEIGCGIGTVSSLIIKYLMTGKFVGCDISAKSIELANKLYGSKNVRFEISDMSEFTSDIKFDFIVFPDVLEHIPVEQHNKLFENISKVCDTNTKVLINIPEPNSLSWVREHNPEILQIIDQSLSMQDLLNNTYPHGFQVQSITPYSIHTNIPNYLSIVLIRNKKVEKVQLKNKIYQFIQNLSARL